MRFIRTSLKLSTKVALVAASLAIAGLLPAAGQSVDLVVVKSASPDPVSIGANLTYTFLVHSDGPDPATGVTVSDTLPPQVTFVSASPGCTHALGVVTCVIGNLAASATVSRSIVVTVAACTAALTNTTTVSGNETDPDPADNVSTTISGAADTTPPLITCPGAANVQCLADVPVVNVATALATDFCDPSPVITHVNDVTNGTCPTVITRTYLATDASGNTNACTQTITVHDTMAPVLTCALDQTVACGTPWTFTAPGVLDNCDPSPIVTILSTTTNSNCGNTLVASRVWEATDFCTNVSTCTQTVSVVDLTPPAITCPTNINAKTVDPAGAVFSFAPSVTDACDAAPVVTCVPASGSVFGFGVTTVNCSAVDACSNSNGCSFTVNLQLRHTTNFVVGTTIPDGNLNGLASTKVVATYIGIITDLDVTLKTTGGFNGDLYAYLVHDSGFSVLLNRVGRTSGDTFGYGDPGFDVTLDDQAANGDIHTNRFTLFGSHSTPIGGPLTGNWAPDGRNSDPLVALDSDTRTDLLNSFNGVNPNGSWTLFIADVSTVDIASLDSWGLDICGLPPIPVSITTQPADLITACTSNATFSINVAGTAPFTNQWYKDGIAIPGAAGLSLTLSNVHPSDAGSYSAIVCNMANCVTSAPALLHVLDTNAPVITACAGNVTNSVDALCMAAVPDLTGLVTAMDACDGVTITQFPAPGSMVSTGSFTITLSATDVSNNVSMCTATFVVRDTTPPAITCPPNLFITTPPGQMTSNVTFTVTATDNCSTAPPIVCTPPSGSSFFSGSSNVTCVATDSVGNSNTCSFGIAIQVPPLVTRQPTNTTGVMGNGVTMSLGATGSVFLSYQWYYNGSPLANGGQFAGVTTPVLVVTNLTLANAGGFTVVVSNPFGSATSQVAVLTVTPIFGISFDFNTPGQYTNAPYNLVNNDWGHSSLFNSQPFGPVVPFEVSTGGVGVATGGGALDLMFNNSATANLNVNSSTLHPLSYDFSLPGKTLYVSAMMKAKFPLANSRAVQIGFTTATNLDLDNSAGRAYMTVLLNSSNAPGTIYNLRSGTKPLPINSFIEGTAAGNFATATLTTNVWYRFSGVFVNNSAVVAGTHTVSATLQDMGLDGTTPGAVVTMPTTSVTNVDVTASRNLFFVLRDQENCGVDYLDNVYISTTNGPVYFVAQPASQTVAQGRTASFRALVDGAGPYTYQWNSNGVPIPGAGNWKYTTPTLAYPGDDGAQYTVTVTSPINTITSSAAIVTVQPDGLAVLSVGSVDGGLIGLRFNQPVNQPAAETAANYLVNGVAAAAAQLRVNNGVQQYKTNGTEVLITPLTPVSGSYTVTVALASVTALSGADLTNNNTAIGRVEGLTGLDVDPLSIGLNTQVGTLPGFNYSFAPGSFEITAGGHDIFGNFDGFRYVYTTKSGDFDVKVRVPYVDALRTPNKAGFNVRVSLDPTSPMVGAYVNPMLPGRNFFEGGVRQLFNVGATSWGNQPPCNFPNAWLRFRRVGNTFMRYSSTNGVNWVFDGQTSPFPSFPETVYFGLAANANVGQGVIQQHATSQYDSYGDFAGYGLAAITITQQPTNPPPIVAGATPLQTAVVATYTTNGVAAPANELAYVWQRTNSAAGGWTNMPIAGQTTANILTAGNIGALFYTPDPAQYRVIISAPGAPSVISDVATITVTDGAPPTVSSPAAFSSNSLPMLSTHQILLNFSEFMDSVTALNPLNYLVTNSAGASMGVASVQFLRGDNRTVVLTTVAPLVGDRYFVVINNVSDLKPNPIAPNTVLNITLRGGPASLASGEAQVVGPIVVEWTPYLANQRAGIGDFINAVASPAWVSYSNVFGIFPVNGAFPNSGVGDNYGARMFTYFVPPTNGTGYKFYLRADDFGEFILNTNADPAKSILPMDVLVGISTNSPGAQNAPQAMDGVVSNYANAKYLSFDKTNTGFYVTPAIGNTTVGGIRFWAAGDAPERDPMTFTLEGSTNVIQDRNRTGTNGPWTLLASGNTGIANTGGASATGRYMPSPNFTFANATPYRSYRVRFPTIRDAVAANSMQIGEVQLLNAGGQVVVPSGATMLIQSITSGSAYTALLSSSNITLNAGQKYYMEMRFKETGGGDGATVCVTNDNGASLPGASAVIPGAFCSFPTPLADPTPVQWEMYTIASSFRIQDFAQFGNVVNGDIIDLLTYTNAARIVARLPQTVGYTKGFGWNTNQGNLQGTFDNYIARLYAYFVAPTNGLYKFWMAVDDSAQLWMNTNAVNSTDPAGMRLLGQQNGANVNHTLVAQNVALLGGRRYYMEGRWREGGGGDGLRVAVTAQTDPATPGNGSFIPGSMLEMATNEVRYGEIKLAGIAASVDGAPAVTASTLNVLPGSVITFNAAGVSGAGTALGISAAANPLASLGLVWLKNGSGLLANMVQESLEFYVTPPVSLADHGSVITLLVSNTFSVATQSVMLNVAAVTPAIVQAVGSLSDDAVTVTFNVPVDPYTSLQVANYSIPGLRILSVSRDDRTGRRVVLRTSPQAMGTIYTLAVSNVRDASGTQTIVPNSMVNFGAWATGGAGAFYVEIFTNIPGSLTENLTSDPKFIYNLPDFTYYTNRFGVGGFGLDSFFMRNNYGARVTGWLTAPSNGVYAFYVRGDDGTKVFMNTNGSDPAGKVLIARNDGANSATFVLGLGLGRVGASVSPPLTLTAGTAYYVEALFKEGGGGDHMEVYLAALDPTTKDVFNPIGGLPAPAVGVIASGTYFSAPGDPGAIAVNLAPDFYATQNQAITLVLNVAASPNLLPFGAFQWQRETAVGSGVFASIPGATSRNLTFNPQLSDHLLQYRVLVSYPGLNGPYTTTLHVAADAEPPVLVTILCDLTNFNTITLIYNEPVDNSQGVPTDPFAYVYDGAPFPGAGGTISADGRAVTFDVPAYLPGSVHTLYVDNIPDLAGIPLVTNAVWQACPITPGIAKFRAYDTASTAGTAVSLLTSHPNYPENPREMAYITTFDSRRVYPNDTHDQYGARLEGMFIPPVSGDYIFQTTSDDASELWFNAMGPGTGGLLLIAQQPACCNNWDGIQSPAQTGLIGGKPYAIRMLYKEGGGGDYGGVAARLATAPAFTGNDVLPQNGTPLNSMRCFQLAVVENVNNPLLPGSILLTGQPADVSLPVGSLASFQVTNTTVIGSIAPPHYRWQISTDGGTNWTDADGCTLQTNIYVRTLLPQDDGALVRCLVMVPDVRAYSAPARITLTQNPVIVNVTTRGNCHEVVAIYTQPMNLDGTYTVSSAYFPGLTTTVLGYGRNNTEVRLGVTPDMAGGLPYLLTVSGATSLAALPIYPAPTVRSFTHGAEYTSIALTYQRYSGPGGVLLSDLYANPNYPNNPNLVTYNQAFFEVPLDVADNYGATISGYYVAPSTGNYRFWMSSDDAGATFLSTDANPANKVQINREPIWNGSRAFADLAGGRRTADGNGYPSETQSAPIALTAGQVVYLEGQMKEGGGGDNYSCAVTINNPVPPANGSLPIPASAFRQFYRSSGGCTFTRLCDVFLNPPPANLTRVEGQTATFSGQADGTPGELICYTYQWYRNGVPIPGATTPSYSTGLLDCNENGVVYSLVAWNDFSSVSNSATLLVTPNTTPPVVVAANTDNTSYQRVFVLFSRALAQVGAETVGNYALTNLGDSTPLPILSAVLQPDLVTVLLTTATQLRNASYSLTVGNVADLSCAPVALNPNPTTLVLNTSNVCLNLVRRDTWTGLPVVPNSMTILYNDPRYPNSPTSTDYLQAFNSPQTAPDVNNYAVRLTGYIVAPETADYQFQVVADDSAYLAVGTDLDPNTPVQLIAVNGDCAACGGPQSAVVRLTAGRAYAVESRFQEGVGGDYLQVYWRNNLSIPSYTIMSGLDVGVSAPLATLNVTSTPNLSAEENTEVILQVTATASTSPVVYQWKKNGVVLPGATGTSISFPVVQLTNAGTYSCYVSCPGACAEPAIVMTVTPDVTAPLLVSVGSLDGLRVGVCFNEPVEFTTGTDPFSYMVNGQLVVTGAELMPGNRRAVLTLSSPITGSFTVDTIDITDQAIPSHTGNSSATGRVMGLTAMDIGTPGVDPVFMGTNFVCTSNTIEVTAGGHDIWDNQDGFNFIYTPFTGDFDMSVRVSRLDFANTWSKAGLMAREDLTPGSRNHHVIVDPTAGANIYEANKRDVADNGPSSWSTSNPIPQYPNAWMRLQRVGDLFSAFASSNNVDWVLFGTSTPVPGYPRTMFLGMSTTSHDNNPGASTFALYHDFTIRDIESPQLDCTDLVVECQGATGTYTNYVVPVIDNADTNPIVVCVPPFPGQFPRGATTVNCTATDASGNSTNCSFTVLVADRTPPVVVCPSNIVLNLASGQCFSNVVFSTPSVMDCDPGAGVVCVPVSGFAFPAGTNTVVCTATDASNNMAMCSFTIAALEYVKPSIVCPPDLTIECGDPSTPPATGSATATDNCDPNVTISYADTNTIEVQPGSLAGWALATVGDPLTATATLVNGPAPVPLGTGSLRLAIGSDGENIARARTTNFGGVFLGALTEMSFRTYVASNSGGGETPLIVLNIDSDNNGTPDDVIGFEPEYQSAVYGAPVPVQGPVATGAWQTWDAMVGGWWSANNTLVMSAGAGVRPLTAYIAAFPNARIVNPAGVGGVRLEAGQGLGTWEDFDGSVDRFTIGVNGVSRMYDFDLTPGDPNPLIVRTWTARDSSGNLISCSQVINVVDTTPPSLSCPPSVLAECSQAGGAIVGFTVTPTDVCDASPSLTCTPASGTFYALGATNVTCVSIDNVGNSNSCSFVVTVVDTTPPVITCSSNRVVECSGSSSATATFVTTATDICDTNPAVVCVPASGSTFAMGVTTVNCTATDRDTNSASCNFTVTVQDTTAPVIVICASDATVLADANCQGVVPDLTGMVSATDCNPISVTQIPLAGSLVPLGSNTVTLSVTDTNSNSSTCTAVVVVVDMIPPVITCPGTTIAECAAPTGTMVTFSPSATDNCTASPAITCVPASGSTFAPGNTTVTCAAVDGAGNSNSCSFVVTVRDTTPPVITCSSNRVVECSGSSSATATFVTTATDLCDTNPAVVCVPVSGSTFAMGVTTVTCTATDQDTNSSMCSFTVTVQDTTAPVIVTCASDVTVLANASCQGIVPDLTGQVSATDCNPTTVTQSPLAGSLVPLGSNIVTLSVTDTNSNSSTCTAVVVVVDMIPPVVTCPGTITVECALSAGTVVSFSATATDNCTASPAVTCVPASGSTFPHGNTTVTCGAVDGAGNSNSCSFVVTVRDTTPPQLCANPTVSFAAGGTNDNFAGPPSDAFPSADLQDSLFGVSSLRKFDEFGSDAWFAHSISGLPANISEAVLRIRLRAVIGIPEGNTIELLFATSGGGVLPQSWLRRIGTGGVDAVPGLLPAPWSNGTVTELVLDLARLPNAGGGYTDLIPTLRDQRYLDLIVQDDTMVDYVILEVKTCQCRPDIAVNVDPLSCGAVVSFPSPVFTDACDSNVIVVCSPGSGTTFPLGTTTVFCTATDDDGNSGRCSFEVKVTEVAPALRIESAPGGNVIVSWPVATCDTYRLEQTLSLNPAISWTTVTASRSISGGEYHVLLPASGLHRFFRLAAP